MPVFEFECRDCGAVTEIAEELQGGRIAARACGACGGRRLAKVMSAFAYHREVTLEDLGIPAPPPGYAPPPSTAPEIGPPPGGCPYAQPPGDKDETP